MTCPHMHRKLLWDRVNLQKNVWYELYEMSRSAKKLFVCQPLNLVWGLGAICENFC